MNKRPNILFLFPDQLRYDWIGGVFGIPVRTPNLDALRQRGATFTNAVCPSPLCAPCRASLALGREYHNHSVKTNHENLPLDEPTVYGMLREAGYHVMGCGKFDLNKGDCMNHEVDTSAWGLDGKALLDEWGFSDGINNEGKGDGYASGLKKPRGPYLQYLEARGLRQTHLDDFTRRRGDQTAAFATPLPDDAYCDNWIGRNALDLLNAAPEGKPWFLQVNYDGPHNPWDITESMKALYRDVDFPEANDNDKVPAEKMQEVRRNYAAMVENIDRWTGRLLDELARRGALDNTLVVFSSDHGEMLGDHNGWGKSKPWQPSIGVPLVLAGPGVQPGQVHRGPATNLDLTATFLDCAGVTVPDTMDSRSLMPLLSGRTDHHRDVVVSALNDWQVAFDGRMKYVEGFGKTALYDLAADPGENHNLIDDPACAEAPSKLQTALPQQKSHAAQAP